MITRHNLEVAIHELKPYEKNARTHSPAQIEKIARSITEWGFTNPILVSRETSGYSIIAGHGRALAASKLGLATVPAVELRGLSEAQKKALVLADNRLAEDAGWDDRLLALELGDLQGLGFDLSLTGFSELELGKITGIGDPVDGEDDVPEPPVTPISVAGDVWQLGEHRVMCGNSGSFGDCRTMMGDDNASMVFTDPPYGVAYQSNGRTKSKKFDVIAGDREFLTEWVPNVTAFSHGWVFVWTTWRVIREWMDICAPIGDLSNQVIWDKGGGGIGDLTGTFATDYEIALVYNRGAKITGKRLGSVWDIGKDVATSYVHPTQKPVALAVQAIENCTNSGDMVLDLFGGSGSTLIACEKLGRRCRVLEIDQKYVDVIVRRWELFTGKKAVHATTGRAFDEHRNAA